MTIYHLHKNTVLRNGMSPILRLKHDSNRREKHISSAYFEGL
jgi:hypothetical protein